MPGILLDTNVLSELMRPAPAQEVLAWFRGQHGSRYYISAITEAEILLGIALLPQGQRRDRLAAAAEAMFQEDFAGRSLAFDSAAAAEYALLVARRQRSGRPISTEDGLIAALALHHGLPLATRNTRDFEGIGLSLLNPWQ